MDQPDEELINYTIIRDNDSIVVEFPHRVHWIAFSRRQAIEFAKKIFELAKENNIY